MEYYAKSANPQGHQETVKEHLQMVAALAREYGEVLGLSDAAKLGAEVHDFGKYPPSFQDVMKGTRTGIDHAISGACFLECCYKGSPGSRPVIEAVNGHHDGLIAYDMIKAELHAITDEHKQAHGNAGKTPSIENRRQLEAANAAFRKDFPDFRLPKLPMPPTAELESMLYTRMLFSCLVDADYTVSAMNDDSTYPDRAEDSRFDPQMLLEKLYAYRDCIRQASTADKTLNRYRIAASIIPRLAFVRKETQLYEQALRRIRGGKCYFQSVLGLREFVCYFEESDGMLLGHHENRNIPSVSFRRS